MNITPETQQIGLCLQSSGHSSSLDTENKPIRNRTKDGDGHVLTAHVKHLMWKVRWRALIKSPVSVSEHFSHLCVVVFCVWITVFSGVGSISCSVTGTEFAISDRSSCLWVGSIVMCRHSRMLRWERVWLQRIGGERRGEREREKKTERKQQKKRARDLNRVFDSKLSVRPCCKACVGFGSVRGKWSRSQFWVTEKYLETCPERRQVNPSSS